MRAKRGFYLNDKTLFLLFHSSFHFQFKIPQFNRLTEMKMVHGIRVLFMHTYNRLAIWLHMKMEQIFHL